VVLSHSQIHHGAAQPAGLGIQHLPATQRRCALLDEQMNTTLNSGKRKKRAEARLLAYRLESI